MFLPTVLRYLGPQSKGRTKDSFLHLSAKSELGSDEVLEQKDK